jgi:hypothetical protein
MAIPDGSLFDSNGKIKNEYLPEMEIEDGSATTKKIAAGAVTEAKLADGAVTALKLGMSAVTTEKLAANTVTDAKLGNRIIDGESKTLTGWLQWMKDTAIRRRGAAPPPAGAVYSFEELRVMRDEYFVFSPDRLALPPDMGYTEGILYITDVGPATVLRYADVRGYTACASFMYIPGEGGTAEELTWYDTRSFVVDSARDYAEGGGIDGAIKEVENNISAVTRTFLCTGTNDDAAIEAMVNDFFANSTEMGMKIMITGTMGLRTSGLTSASHLALEGTNTRGAVVFLDFSNCRVPAVPGSNVRFLHASGGVKLVADGLSVTSNAGYECVDQNASSGYLYLRSGNRVTAASAALRGSAGTLLVGDGNYVSGNTRCLQMTGSGNCVIGNGNTFTGGGTSSLCVRHESAGRLAIGNGNAFRSYGTSLWVTGAGTLTAGEIGRAHV